MAKAHKQHVRSNVAKNPKRPRKPRADPIVTRAHDWIAARDAQDALTRKWQDAEHRLSLRIKPLKMTLMEAGRGDLPEARTMRALMRRIKAADRKLDREAAQIALAQPTSPLGALAKIEMALRILAWMDSREHAWALLEGGAGKLREFLLSPRRRAPTAGGLSAATLKKRNNPPPSPAPRYSSA